MKTGGSDEQLGVRRDNECSKDETVAVTCSEVHNGQERWVLMKYTRDGGGDL